MVNCDCPHCGSLRTQALPMLHAAGIRRYDWHSNSLFYYRGAAGIRSTRGRGRSQSHLSELSRPPVASTTAALRTGAALVIVILTIFGGWSGFGLAVGGLLVLAIVRGIAEGDDHARALEDWHVSFRCARCGTIFRIPTP